MPARILSLADASQARVSPETPWSDRAHGVVFVVVWLGVIAIYVAIEGGCAWFVWRVI